MLNESEFNKRIATLGVSAVPSAFNKFEKLISLLVEYNSHTNVTSITSPSDIWEKHIFDSLTVVPHIPSDTTSLMDIGSGAGFPGLPIAIMKPSIQVTLIDSVGKKTKFISEVIQALSIPHATVLTNRAEILGLDPTYRETFDVVTARAVTQLPQLCELALPLVKTNGLFIALKSRSPEEIASAKNAIQTLGGELYKEIQHGEKSLIIIRKVAKTPAPYPRRTNTISKKPL